MKTHLKFRCQSTVIYLLIFLMYSCQKDIKTRATTTDGSAGVLISAKPNILFIVGDDIGYEVLTSDGGRSYSTPNLDALAGSGVRFTQAHGSPVCSPSRVALLTGEYNFRNYTQWGHLNPSERTIGNMFSENGYMTCYAGKWQLDGGDIAIKGFGWQYYSVWLPFLLPQENMGGSRYKSPKIYQGGDYLPDSVTADKYSEDIYTSYIMNFIDSATLSGKPFFAYYSMNLAHAPFCPTPDDPEFPTWDPNKRDGDTSFFPSMVKYMDKKIGQLYGFLQSRNLLENTVIVYVGDNGTPPNIRSNFNDTLVKGGKNKSTELGTNVPLIVTWKGSIVPDQVSNALVDFTDFSTTLAAIAGIPVLLNGTVDGISFSPALFNGDTSILRKTIYCSINSEPDIPGRVWNNWVQNDSYKLYDTNVLRQSYRFVKIAKGKGDSAPLHQLLPAEKAIKNQFIKVLRYYHS